MKSVVLTLAIVVSLFAGPLLVQAEDDEVELIRSMFAADKKVLVANTMQFSDQESKAFWPVYNDYQQAMRKVNDRKIKLITDYVKGYETLTDDKAKVMLKESMDVDKEKLALKRTWVKKFSKVLTPKRVARYFQLENKIEVLVNAELAKNIPLVK